MHCDFPFPAASRIATTEYFILGEGLTLVAENLTALGCASLTLNRF
jgi:hypothetical protein